MKKIFFAILIIAAVIGLVVLAAYLEGEYLSVKVDERNEYESGYDAGYSYGHREGYDEGYDKGYDEGYDKGNKEGYEKAREDLESVLRIEGASEIVDTLYEYFDNNPYIILRVEECLTAKGFSSFVRD